MLSFLRTKKDNEIYLILPDKRKIRIVIEPMGERVRIHTEAPRDVQIVRGELMEGWQNDTKSERRLQVDAIKKALRSKQETGV